MPELELCKTVVFVSDDGKIGVTILTVLNKTYLFFREVGKYTSEWSVAVDDVLDNKKIVREIREQLQELGDERERGYIFRFGKLSNEAILNRMERVIDE